MAHSNSNQPSNPTVPQSNSSQAQNRNPFRRNPENKFKQTQELRHTRAEQDSTKYPTWQPGREFTPLFTGAENDLIREEEVGNASRIQTGADN